MENVVAVSPIRSGFARAVSDLFSPPAVAMPALLLGAWLSDSRGAYFYALLYFVIAVMAPVAYVLWLVRTGRVTDFHLPDRRDRRGPFIASLVGGVLAIGLLAYLGASQTLLAPIVTLLLQILLLFLITLFWQVSIHTATIAGLVTFAVLAIGPAAAWSVGLVPLVGWARVYLGRHSVAQTIAGAILGASCFGLLFALKGVVW